MPTLEQGADDVLVVERMLDECRELSARWATQVPGDARAVTGRPGAVIAVASSADDV